MKRVLTALVFLAACSTAFAQSPVVTSFTGGGGPFGSFYGTLLPSGDVVGYRFTADANITITDLGILEDPIDGVLDSRHMVGLWRNSDMMLLGSTLVGASDPLISGFRYASIAPVALVSGDEYTLGAMYSGDDGDGYFSGPSSITTDMISGTMGVEPGVGDLGFVYPVVTSPGNLGRIGPNAIWIPEPATLTLFAFAGVFAIRRR